MAGSINLAEYVARITLDQSNLSKGLDEADKKIKTSLENISEKTGQAFKNIGGKVESAGKSFSKISVPLAGIGIAALKVGSDFQAGMSQVQAISGATGEDLDRLTEKAKEMGASTKFSATESAEALMYMSMAGWDTNQMLDALEGVMMLAASSGEDLALVSDIVTDSMTAFGLEASEASNFADLLASASSNSNTNVSMMGETFKYVAPLFGSLGYSAEDAALATGLMANAGIKAGQAGTALRSAISNLVNPTDKTAIAMERLGLTITDANGEMLPFQDIMIQLREKFADLSEEQQAQYAATIFGQQAMSGMLAIINAGEEDFNNLTDATRNYNGVAKEMSDIMEDNLQGRLRVLKSLLEGLGIQIFDILFPTFSNLVEKLKSLAEWFSNLSPRTQEIIVKIGLLTACIGPALVIIGKLIAIVGSAITTFGTITTAVAGAGSAIGLLASPIGIAIVAIGAIIAIGVILYKNWDTIKEKAGQLKDKISETWDSMKTKISGTWDNIKTNTSKTWDNIKDKTSKTWELMKKKVDEHGGGIKGIIGTYMEGYQRVWDTGFSQMDKLTGGKLSSMVNAVRDKTNNIKNTISQNISNAANSWNTNVSNMLSNAQSKFSSMANAVSNAFSKVTSAISKGINSLLDWNRQRVENKQATFTTKIKEITEKVTNFVTGKTPSYDVGTPFVPTDQLAFLHKGEAVIPAKYNPYTTNNNLGGNVINIGGSQIKLEVQGNLDSDILPDVKKMIDNSIKQAEERQIIELNKSGIFRKVAVI